MRLGINIMAREDEALHVLSALSTLGAHMETFVGILGIPHRQPNGLTCLVHRLGVRRDIHFVAGEDNGIQVLVAYLGTPRGEAFETKKSGPQWDFM